MSLLNDLKEKAILSQVKAKLPEASTDLLKAILEELKKELAKRTN